MKLLKEEIIAKMNYTRLTSYRKSVKVVTWEMPCDCGCGNLMREVHGDFEVPHRVKIAEGQLKVVNKYWFPLRKIHG